MVAAFNFLECSEINGRGNKKKIMDADERVVIDLH